MKIKENLIYREEDAVVFNTSQGKIMELNDSANEIVKLLNKKNTKKQIIEGLKSVYPDSSVEELKDCVEDFIIDAKKVGLLNEEIVS